MPPEFRAWVSSEGRPVDPRRVDLSVRLTRLGNQIDEIGFQRQDDFLRGMVTVYEPHSFVVSVDASYGGRASHCDYESFEGRTRISAEMADAFGLETMLAGPAVIEEVISVAVVREPFGKRFQPTGLDSIGEATQLALLTSGWLQRSPAAGSTVGSAIATSQPWSVPT